MWQLRRSRSMVEEEKTLPLNDWEQPRLCAGMGVGRSPGNQIRCVHNRFDHWCVNVVHAIPAQIRRHLSLSGIGSVTSASRGDQWPLHLLCDWLGGLDSGGSTHRRKYAPFATGGYPHLNLSLVLDVSVPPNCYIRQVVSDQIQCMFCMQGKGISIV
jgi:hypothetical protein